MAVKDAQRAWSLVAGVYRTSASTRQRAGRAGVEAPFAASGNARFGPVRGHVKGSWAMASADTRPWDQPRCSRLGRISVTAR